MLQSKARLLEINAKLAETLTDKGVKATADETTTALVNKVSDITSGDTIYFSKDGRTYTKSIILPESVSEIGSNAYQHCTNIESIIIPAGVKTIGVAAFLGCINLKKCIIGHGVNAIQYRSFENCNNLEVLFLPNTINAIHERCYMTHSLKLREVILEDGFNYSLVFLSTLLERNIVLNMFNALADRTGLDSLTFQIKKQVADKLTDEDKAILALKNWTLVEN